LVGIFIAIFAKEGVAKNLTCIETNIIKTGALGLLGNKGSCIIRFNYYLTNLVFSCGHFASGDDKHITRIEELLEILDSNFKINQKKDIKFKEHDAAFIFGDLNFRIDLDNTQCRQLIKTQRHEILRTFDQFNIEKQLNPNISDLEEGELDFNPTYKFDINTNNYDTSKKQRVPSWCDRIFWRKTRFIKLIKYQSVNYTLSDHRPIYGIFKVKFVKSLDEIINSDKNENEESQKELLLKELLKESQKESHRELHKESKGVNINPPIKSIFNY
jgi:hypothetical protein